MSDVKNIKRKIDNYSDTKSKYQKLKVDLGNVCGFLSESKNTIEEASDYLANYYSVNDNSADNGHLGNSGNKLEAIRTNIKNEIIPEIDKEISKINRSLSILKEDLKEARDNAS